MLKNSLLLALFAILTISVSAQVIFRNWGKILWLSPSTEYKVPGTSEIDMNHVEKSWYTDKYYTQEIPIGTTRYDLLEGTYFSRTLTKVKSGRHWVVDPWIFYHDDNSFRDNAMFVSGDFASGFKITLTRSDKDPLSVFFDFWNAGADDKAHGPYRLWHSEINLISLIFDKNQSTQIDYKVADIEYLSRCKDHGDNYCSCSENIPHLDVVRVIKIKSDYDKLLNSLKRYSTADVLVKTTDGKSYYFSMDLKGSSKMINKIIKDTPPTTKNSSYIYQLGLVNSNPFDLETYVDKFIEDARKNHGIDLSHVNRGKRLIIFRQLNEQEIALASEKDNDSKVLVFVDPEDWNTATQSLRYYIVYHELGHDILNLDHGEGGDMMNAYKQGSYSWQRFESDKTTMFDWYKANKGR